jgi:apolipoprotein N-acyltransferase
MRRKATRRHTPTHHVYTLSLSSSFLLSSSSSQTFSLSLSRCSVLQCEFLVGWNLFSTLLYAAATLCILSVLCSVANANRGWAAVASLLLLCTSQMGGGLSAPSVTGTRACTAAVLQRNQHNTRWLPFFCIRPVCDLIFLPTTRLLLQAPMKDVSFLMF